MVARVSPIDICQDKVEGSSPLLLGFSFFLSVFFFFSGSSYILLSIFSLGCG